MRVVDLFQKRTEPEQLPDVWPTTWSPKSPDPRRPWEISAEIAAERAAAIERATEFRRAGRRGRALYEMARSVERQARIAGLGTPRIHPHSLQSDVGWWQRP